MQFSPTSCHVLSLRSKYYPQQPDLKHSQSLLGPNIILNALISNTLSLRSSLKARNKISRPYKTTDKVIVF
jgi:hypothetical protein